MKTVVQVVLALLGLFSGGCSLLFLSVLIGEGFQFADAGILVLPLFGIGVAVLCFIGVRNLGKKP